MVDINDAWIRLSGYPRAEIPTIAAWLEKAHDEPMPSQALASITRLRTLEQRVEQNEFTVRTASGEERAWRFGAAALDRDRLGRRLVVSVASDVTALRRFERER